MIIQNFTLKRFMRKSPELISEYIVALSYMNPCETKNQVRNLTLNQVEIIKKNLYSGGNEQLIKIVSFVQGITERKVLRLRIIEFYKIVKSIQKQLKGVYDAEKQLVPTEVNVKWEMVEGSETMSKFGILNTLERLSQGDALKYDLFLEKQYSFIFAVLLLKSKSSELEYKMSKIKLKNE